MVFPIFPFTQFNPPFSTSHFLYFLQLISMIIRLGLNCDICLSDYFVYTSSLQLNITWHCLIFVLYYYTFSYISTYTRAWWKVLALPKTDKRQLGKDPESSWCHLHTSVQPFWSPHMASWISAVAYLYTAVNVHGAMGCDKKGFTLVSLVPSFTKVRPRTFRYALVFCWKLGPFKLKKLIIFCLGNLMVNALIY